MVTIKISQIKNYTIQCIDTSIAIPPSEQTIEIPNAQKELSGNSIYVFPNRTHPTKTMSNNTILKAISLMGYKDKTTGHGFRALAMSTIKEKPGYRHEVIDRQLAHAQKNKVDAAYDQAKFIDERKKMMQEWADYLDAAAEQSKVVKSALQNDLLFRQGITKNKTDLLYLCCTYVVPHKKTGFSSIGEKPVFHLYPGQH